MSKLMSHQENENQIHFTVSRKTIMKMADSKKCKQDIKKLDNSYAAGRKVKWSSHFGNMSGRSAKS